jgi:hypothetical protein
VYTPPCSVDGRLRSSCARRCIIAFQPVACPISLCSALSIYVFLDRTSEATDLEKKLLAAARPECSICISVVFLYIVMNMSLTEWLSVQLVEPSQLIVYMSCKTAGGALHEICELFDRSEQSNINHGLCALVKKIELQLRYIWSG